MLIPDPHSGARDDVHPETPSRGTMDHKYGQSLSGGVVLDRLVSLEGYNGRRHKNVKRSGEELNHSKVPRCVS